MLLAVLERGPAQQYPSKPARIIVPFGAGGPADIYARYLAQRLQEPLGQSFVIDNRPGAGSIIGTDLVAKSPPDGYTLLLMSNTHTVNESLVPKKPFALMKDFLPIAPINYSDLVLVVHPSVPCEIHQGTDRSGEGQAERPQLCVVRHRHAVSHGRRIVQVYGGRPDRAHSA
jgi:tripartite-type tricarboxylate transporter receptor subunit TctC